MKLGRNNAAVLASAISLATSGNGVQGRVSGNGGQVRRLQGGDPTRWDECISLGLTGAQCEQYILDSVGGDLANHRIPDLSIKMNAQRPAEVLASSKSMFGVPTNMFGEVHCDLNGGASVYPWIWAANDGVDYEIANVPCAGLSAPECCDAVLAHMNSNNIPTTDEDGNCFTCWVHQQPLEPRLNDIGVVVYADHSYNADLDECIETVYSAQEVQSEDTNVEGSLIGVRSAIGGLLTSASAGPVACSDVIAIRRDVLFYGRAFPLAMTAISNLLCGQCEAAGETVDLSAEQLDALTFARTELAGVVKSDENCIVIYTDATGDKVLKVPQVGGSLNDSPPEEIDTVGDGMGAAGCPPGQENDGQGACMCPGVTDMADHEAYWVEGGTTNTAGTGSCECPSNLIELNDKCYCPGGFKLWDPSALECVCPYGQDDSGKCICPSPFTALDLGWNGIGWVESPGFNGAAGCKIDTGCTYSEFDYYDNDNIAAGCYGCRYGTERNGICALNCDETEGYGSGFVYSNAQDKCICEESAHVVINGDCMCPAFGQVIKFGQCECENPIDYVSDEGVCIAPGSENDDFNGNNPYGYSGGGYGGGYNYYRRE